MELTNEQIAAKLKALEASMEAMLSMLAEVFPTYDVKCAMRIHDGICRHKKQEEQNGAGQSN